MVILDWSAARARQEYEEELLAHRAVKAAAVTTLAMGVNGAEC